VDNQSCLLWITCVPADPMPPAEHEITENLVRELLAEQHADLGDRELRFENEGWDSAIYRLGADLAVRLPRRAINAALVPVELRWMPELAPRLSLPVSSPVRAGQPGCGYPWPWTITPWFDGESWADADVDDLIAAANALGGFVRALAIDTPAGAPSNPYRGGPLTDRDPAFRDRVVQLGEAIDTDAVVAVWDAALSAPLATRRAWVHGDLHPANIVVHDGQLAAVIDWVDLNGGDRAYDLAAAWMCFADRAARQAFIVAAAEADEATWVRARGCALSHAIACLASSADNRRMHEVGQRTLDAVLSDRP
jgi:aminoglycoside phosphotransferase (APT) family kinase protein